MIHRTFSTLPSFKAMKFRPGLNIVLPTKIPARLIARLATVLARPALSN